MSEPRPTAGPTAAAPAGRPGRYERSFSGLVAAMVVLVGVVLLIVGYRALFREELEVGPTPVDYREAGEAVARAGIPVVLPSTLPSGWIATSAEVERGAPPVWRLGVLTDEERFVGLRHGDVEPDELLESTYPDDEPVEVDPVEVADAAVATRWQAYEVGEDLAWVADLGTTAVVVHGSAPAEDLATFVETLEELPAAQAQPAG
ncbi:DUF4245 family protein [Nocardioides perillae]|uniref:DUF4245 domain-containing protein n=1 Tax=Nocardioides perillae TaxID=1119534 RepID=A0A7Y9RXV7_9ACTN|nr:hypothetical protein [Nocardioides perillae]